MAFVNGKHHENPEHEGTHRRVRQSTKGKLGRLGLLQNLFHGRGNPFTKRAIRLPFGDDDPEPEPRHEPENPFDIRPEPYAGPRFEPEPETPNLPRHRSRLVPFPLARDNGQEIGVQEWQYDFPRKVLLNKQVMTRRSTTRMATGSPSITAMYLFKNRTAVVTIRAQKRLLCYRIKKAQGDCRHRAGV